MGHTHCPTANWIHTKHIVWPLAICDSNASIPYASPRINGPRWEKIKKFQRFFTQSSSKLSDDDLAKPQKMYSSSRCHNVVCRITRALPAQNCANTLFMTMIRSYVILINPFIHSLRSQFTFNQLARGVHSRQTIWLQRIIAFRLFSFWKLLFLLRHAHTRCLWTFSW